MKSTFNKYLVLIAVACYTYFYQLSTPVCAETFILPENPSDSVVGEELIIRARHEETLLDIARRYKLGYDQIIKANPGINRWLPGEGTSVIIPARYILPNSPKNGIILNLAELRLYYYPPTPRGELPKVITFPVSIGRMDWKTPLGLTKVVRKDKNPPWYPPASIKREHALDGDPLPNMIPGGSPENPLGNYALRLGIAGYLIHGTDDRKSFGIGMRVTHGCVRMYPEDVERMYHMVPVNTPVRIVNQSIKAGWLGSTLFLEAHAPLDEDDLAADYSIEDARTVTLQAAGRSAEINYEKIEKVALSGDGIPEPVAQLIMY
jgi:L,D-transpeptidase ErfK/SrfK